MQKELPNYIEYIKRIIYILNFIENKNVSDLKKLRTLEWDSFNAICSSMYDVFPVEYNYFYSHFIVEHLYDLVFKLHEMNLTLRMVSNQNCEKLHSGIHEEIKKVTFKNKKGSLKEKTKKYTKIFSGGFNWE